MDPFSSPTIFSWTRAPVWTFFVYIHNISAHGNNVTILKLCWYTPSPLQKDTEAVLGNNSRDAFKDLNCVHEWQ